MIFEKHGSWSSLLVSKGNRCRCSLSLLHSWSSLQTNSCAHCCRGSFMQYCWQSINQRQDKNPPGLSCLLSSRYRYGHERGGGGGDTRVGNFLQKNYSTEDGIDGTIGLFRRNSGCSAEQQTLEIPFWPVPQRRKMLGIMYSGTK